MAAPPPLEIRVLGELALRRQGEPVDLPASRKTRALLGYLVAAERPVARAELCDLLWDGPVDPRAELRWSLSKLRALLGRDHADALRADGDGLRFVPDGIAVDHRALCDAERRGLDRLSAPELSALEALFRGEFLATLDLPDCFRFDAWLTAERERLFALRSSLLERLCSPRAEDPGRALSAARSWVALDPLSEPAHAAAVRWLRTLGRPRDAERQAETCRRILRLELGVDPGPTLAQARRTQLSANRAAAVVGAEPVSVGDSLALIGRGVERAAAIAALDERVSCRGARLVLVTGEPGIGKSRLLADLIETARGAGGRVVVGRGFETESSRPYGLWIDLLRGLPEALGDDLEPALAWLLPGRQGSAKGVADEPFDRERLAVAVARLMAGAARGQPPFLLVVDDLQWVDEASIALLHLVLERLAAEPLLAAAAARTGELPSAGPAARLTRDLERDGALLRLPLGLLDPAETELLVRSLAPGLDAARLALESGGHPLFAVELARSGGGEGGSLPPRLTALVGERLSRLGDAARALVSWAAALATDFDVDLLQRLSGLEPAALLTGLEELERASLLRADSRGERYDFAHDVVRRVAYEQIAGPRRRWLHAEIARTLVAEADPDGGGAATLARHAGLGGENMLAVPAALAAGERALRLFALVEAREHAERGLAQLARADSAGELTQRLGLLRVLVHATRGRSGRAGLVDEIQRCVELARTAGRTEELRLALYLAAVTHEQEGDLAAAERHVLRAAEVARVTVASADPASAARTIANTGRCLAQIERDHAHAESLLLEARELAARAGVEVVEVSWGLGLLADAAGRDAEARRELERAVAGALVQGEAWIASQCLVRLAALAVGRGDLAEVRRRCTEVDALAAEVGDGSERAVAASLLALAAWRAGESGAAAELERAIGELRVADSRGALALVLNGAAATELERGGVDPEILARAERFAGEALAHAEAVGRRGQIAAARTLLGRAAFAAGRVTDARGHLRAALEQDRPRGVLGGRIRGELEALKAWLRPPTPIPTVARQRGRRRKGAPK